MVMLNIDTKDPATEIWKEICVIFGDEVVTDKHIVIIHIEYAIVALQIARNIYDLNLVLTVAVVDTQVAY